MKAKLIANRRFIVDQIDNRIYGSFLEHLGRAVYNGIYEPTHPTADDAGFRQDVLELIQKLQVPIVRYPGGNFVSGYNWEDGIGDKSKRPQKLDQARFSVETNQMGIDEFQEWAKRANTEVMMAVNLGTRGAEDARNCVEYCNADTPTYYADLRRKNGFEKPFGIKVWCLGNEMDGRWQICHKTADEYGRLAAEAAKLMKWVDPSIELVACGSSGAGMKTFGDWEMTVLDHTYDFIDYISLHSYYGNTTEDTPNYLARAEAMDRFIKDAAALCDAVKAKKHHRKTMHLSIDEWNVWYRTKHDFKRWDVFSDPNAAQNRSDCWQIAPHLLEEVYNFEDALLVGCLLMTLQNNCDRVKMACLAQLVNVIAPIMTENGGNAWVQTIFYPFLYASLYGRGTALRPIMECDSYLSSENWQVPFLSASVIHDEQTGTVTVFAVNRSLEENLDLDIDLENFASCRLTEHVELYCPDLKAVNTKDDAPVAPVCRPVNSHGPVVLKKHSWNMLRFRP